MVPMLSVTGDDHFVGRRRRGRAEGVGRRDNTPDRRLADLGRIDRVDRAVQRRGRAVDVPEV